MAKKHYKSKRKGRMYIVCPTLETLLLSCCNVKDAASVVALSILISSKPANSDRM